MLHVRSGHVLVHHCCYPWGDMSLPEDALSVVLRSTPHEILISLHLPTSRGGLGAWSDHSIGVAGMFAAIHGILIMCGSHDDGHPLYSMSCPDDVLSKLP